MHRRHRILLWRIWYRIWAVVAVATIAIALLFSVLRLLFPLVPGYKHELEELAADILQHPVSIGRISTDWQWFKPRIKLLEVEILSEVDNLPVVKVDQLLLGLDVFDTLIDWKVDVDEITLLGSSLDIERDNAGVVSVQGVNVFVPSSELEEIKLEIPPALQNRTIKLADINIHYTDEIFNLDYQAHTVNISLKLKSKTAALYLDIGLPEELGDRIEFGLETYGDLAEPKTLSGKVFIRGSDLHPANWKQPAIVPQQIKSGAFNVAFWVDVKAPKTFDLAGYVNTVDLVLSLPALNEGSNGEWSADELNLDVFMRLDDKQITANISNLYLQRDGIEWPVSNISLHTPRKKETRFKQGQLALDFFRIEDILPWIKAYVPGSSVIEESGVSAISGDIKNTYLRWDLLAEEQQLIAQTELDSINLYGQGKIPTVKGVKANLRLNENQAAIELDINALHFYYPQMFRDVLPLTEIRGEIQAQRTDEGFSVSARALQVNNPDMQSLSWFDYDIDLGDKPLWMDHYSQFEVFNAGSTSKYLPVGTMKGRNSLRWLDNAFISGVAKNGEFTLHGPADKMPFRNGEGVFRIEFDSDGNVLNIWEPGPYATNIRAHAIFDGPSLYIYGYETKILDTVAQDIIVRIDDMQKTPLLISGKTYGSTQDAWEYIKQSKLRRIFSEVEDQLTVNGNQASDIDLTIEINSDKEDEYKIITHMIDSKVSFNDWGLHFSNLRNDILVTQDEVSTNEFYALLNGQPVTINADTRLKGKESIVSTQLRGDVALGEFLNSMQQPIAEHISGRSQIDAVLDLALSKNTDGYRRKPLLKVSSDLIGTEISLPQPLVKKADRQSLLSTKTIFNDSSIDTHFSFGDFLCGALRSEKNGDEVKVTHADIRFGKGEPKLPKIPGVIISGHAPTLNIDQWQSLSWTDSVKQGMSNHVRSIDLKADRFIYLHRSVEDMNFKLNRLEHNWEINLNSEQVRGRVLVPMDGFEKRGLVIDLDYADYDQISEGHDGKQPQPSDVPPFKLAVEKMKFNEWDLRGVSIFADQIDDTLKIHSIRIADPAVGLEGNGEWVKNKNGKHHTSMRLKFNSSDFGEGLQRFGFENVVKGGKGLAEFDIYWDASPSGFDLEIMQGRAEITARKGQVLDLKPGSGRIIGLLSLQTIPRRLALDFRDLFSKGYMFDKMNGSFTFDSGNAYSSDYYIDGPVGRLDIKGRTGLVQRDYDQQVVFRPELSNSLPVIGALLGGSSGGVGMLLVDGLVRLFGGDTDDIAKARYTVTGSWEDPVITPVKEKNEEVDKKENQRQSKREKKSKSKTK